MDGINLAGLCGMCSQSLLTPSWLNLRLGLGLALGLELWLALGLGTVNYLHVRLCEALTSYRFLCFYFNFNDLGLLTYIKFFTVGGDLVIVV